MTCIFFLLLESILPKEEKHKKLCSVDHALVCARLFFFKLPGRPRLLPLGGEGKSTGPFWSLTQQNTPQHYQEVEAAIERHSRDIPEKILRRLWEGKVLYLSVNCLLS